MKAGWPPDSTGDAAGSTATMRVSARRLRSTSPTPVMVPPVPTALTNASTRGSCFRISGPVVRRCASGFAGLLNCCGMYHSGFSANSSSARRTAACMPSCPA
jgi:hypothetical protein